MKTAAMVVLASLSTGTLDDGQATLRGGLFCRNNDLLENVVKTAGVRVTDWDKVLVAIRESEGPGACFYTNEGRPSVRLHFLRFIRQLPSSDFGIYEVYVYGIEEKEAYTDYTEIYWVRAVKKIFYTVQKPPKAARK